ncbi:MAG TPA: AAA family ATPase [Bacteroidales bacterium]|nr:AAA family ATPase [Bacteroidales bacterium]HPT03025.1 AAA family ATPase [Bacteroidales bacterium]
MISGFAKPYGISASVIRFSIFNLPENTEMDQQSLKNNIYRQFPYSPTPGQERLIELLTDFVLTGKGNFPLFILEGYAGTGKTTVISALVKVLPRAGYTPVLLAPTGRAAKVFSGYAERPASTIHKKLYRSAMDKEGRLTFRLMPNTLHKAFFIVDEASMIPDSRPGENSLFNSRNLLEDLMQHVYSGSAGKMLFLGDNAQLPPVGINYSPALNIEFLRSSFGLDITHYMLTDVVRQSLESGILSVATGIRLKIGNFGSFSPLFGQRNVFPDVRDINGDEMPDALHECYSHFGRENTVVITRSNKRANLFNQGIRQRILSHESDIAAGDHLMVVRNNYFWLPEETHAGFIANGDIIELQRIGKIEELYGFRFAHVTMRMIDYPDDPAYDVILLLDTLNTETPSLSETENRRLYDAVMEDYMDIPSRLKRMAEVRKNQHFNALQVKHANALTCHKTQGGQWDAVFIDKGYLTNDMLNDEYLRWLYTAVTRAAKILYLVNFEEKFFE